MSKAGTRRVVRWLRIPRSRDRSRPAALPTTRCAPRPPSSLPTEMGVPQIGACSRSIASPIGRPARLSAARCADAMSHPGPRHHRRRKSTARARQGERKWPSDSSLGKAAGECSQAPQGRQTTRRGNTRGPDSTLARDGTASVVPEGTRLRRSHKNPAMNRWAIVGRPGGTWGRPQSRPLVDHSPRGFSKSPSMWAKSRALRRSDSG